MSEMVEKVARELFKMFRGVRPLGDAWQDYAADARTIIAVMREPTEDMLFVGQHQIEDCSENECSAHALHAWRLMIDAALSPAEQSA